MKVSKTLRLLSAAGLGIAISMAASASSVNDAIAERIKPVGDVCMAGSDCAAAPVAAAPSGPRSGAEVYDTKCFTCHATGAAGAPKVGDVDGWAPRIGKGIDTLYTNALNGINGMPAKGLCMDCSDDEITAAVDHMVASSK
ncbi:MAG: cytochrome c5 family protein [Candidatus Pelagadaptatus aseana]